MTTETSESLAELDSLPRAADLLARQLSEADIAWLEQQDITDPLVQTALKIGYEQNDPAIAGRVILGVRSMYRYSYGDEARLKNYIAEAEAELEHTPTDSYNRTKRMMARLGLAENEIHRQGLGPANLAKHGLTELAEQLSEPTL